MDRLESDPEEWYNETRSLARDWERFNIDHEFSLTIAVDRGCWKTLRFKSSKLDVHVHANDPMLSSRSFLWGSIWCFTLDSSLDRVGPYLFLSLSIYTDQGFYWRRKTTRMNARALKVGCPPPSIEPRHTRGKRLNSRLKPRASSNGEKGDTKQVEFVGSTLAKAALLSAVLWASPASWSDAAIQKVGKFAARYGLAMSSSV